MASTLIDYGVDTLMEIIRIRSQSPIPQAINFLISSFGLARMYTLGLIAQLLCQRRQHVSENNLTEQVGAAFDLAGSVADDAGKAPWHALTAWRGRSADA